MINKQKGAYMFYDKKTDSNILYLYMKLSKEQLQKALVWDYCLNPAGTNLYLNAFFVKGMDYLGQSTYEEVVKKIESNGMVDILNSTYTTVVNKTRHLSLEEFNNQLHFSREQLDICQKSAA